MDFLAHHFLNYQQVCMRTLVLMFACVIAFGRFYKIGIASLDEEASS